VKGVIGPALFGKLVETGKEVNAERRSLEGVAKPLTAEEAETESSA
jgi:hypothetical protein